MIGKKYQSMVRSPLGRFLVKRHVLPIGNNMFCTAFIDQAPAEGVGVEQDTVDTVVICNDDIVIVMAFAAAVTVKLADFFNAM